MLAQHNTGRQDGDAVPEPDEHPRGAEVVDDVEARDLIGVDERARDARMVGEHRVVEEDEPVAGKEFLHRRDADLLRHRPRRVYQHQLLGTDGLGVEREVRIRRVEESGIELVQFEQVDQGGGRTAGDPELVESTGAQGAADHSVHRLVGEPVVDAEHDLWGVVRHLGEAAGHRQVVSAEYGGGIRQVPNELGGVGQEVDALPGQPDAVPGPLEKGEAEALFEASQPLAHGRLGGVEGGGRLGDASVFGDGQEGFDDLEVHGPLLPDMWLSDRLTIKEQRGGGPSSGPGVVMPKPVSVTV
nr:hypothetical protein [Streptomyces sp. WM6372]